MNKKVKIVLRVVVVLILVFFVAGIIIGNIFFNLALVPGSDKSKVFSAPHNQLVNNVDQQKENEIAQRREQEKAWFSGQERTDVYQTSEDGLKLHATRLENPKGGSRWAILCHGYGGNGLQMSGRSMHFYEMGFNILLPDARGSLPSEGSYTGMGWLDRRDLMGWTKQIVEEDPDAEIVLYGVSMGGATVMMTAGEADLPENVKAIVEDCGYTSVWGEFSYQLKSLFNLPDFPVMHFSSLVTRVRARYWLSAGSAIDQLARTQKPILFIHGDEDTFVPFFMLDEVYEASNGPKEKIVVEGAGHGGAADIMGPAYWESVEAFVFQYVSG